MGREISISGSVGRQGQNKKPDVALIQRMLNQSIQPKLKALSVDGIVGSKTVSAIEWYQKHKVGMTIPDGRIDPNGKTFAALTSPSVQGTAKPPDSPAIPKAGSDPVALDFQAAEKLIDPASKLPIGGIWGDVKSGETWLGTDGSRLVMTASYRGVIYLLNTDGRIYLQSARGFVGEVTTYPFIEGARRAAPMVRLIELEIQFILGIVGATSGVGFVAVAGSSILAFVVENRQNFAKWSRLASALMTARSSLKQIAPTLYDKVFDALLFVLIKDVIPNTPGAITADGAAKMVGAIVGKLGKKAAEGKFSVLTILMTLLGNVATKCLTSVPKAISVTAGEYKQSADKLVDTLRASGVTISLDDAQKIFEEIRQHPKEIRDLLGKIEAAGK